MENKPLVSIIMPFKNSMKYLSDCLESIQNQSYPYWELIAVDDHSEDRSAEFIVRFFQNNTQVTVIKNEGIGIIDALQTALNQCTGTYLTRMDSDDFMPEKRLELMQEAMQSSKPKTIVTGKVKYEAPVLSSGYLKYENWLNNINKKAESWKHIYRECVIASPNWMIRRSELIAMNAFADLSYPEDYHLVLKWYSLGFQVKYIDKMTLIWREHPDRTSRNSPNYNQEKFFELKIQHFLNHDYQTKNLVLWGVGVKGRLTADLLEKRNVTFHWMDLHPKKFKQGIKGHKIESFQKLEELDSRSTQILLAIYPEKEQKENMEYYLKKHGYILGHNFWYL